MKNTINYPEGKGKIISKLSLEYTDYDNYEFFLQVLSKKIGYVDFIGFLSIEGELLVNGHNSWNINSYWAEPISTILIDSNFYLYKNDVIILNLNISAQFYEQNQIHNETVYVILSTSINYNESDIGNIEVIFIWIYVMYFSCYFLIPYILFLIFRPVFGLYDSDIDETKRQKYFDAISKKSKLERD